jgi:hypothetical protein
MPDRHVTQRRWWIRLTTVIVLFFRISGGLRFPSGQPLVRKLVPMLDAFLTQDGAEAGH